MAEHEMPKVEFLEQHRWLKQLVGEWICTMDTPMPNGEPAKAAVERFRALGDIWVQGETQTEIPGVGPAVMQMTLGYDPQKKRFVGTWFGSMMNYLWVYEGDLDAAGKVLTLNAEGPSMAGEGGMAKYHDIITFVGPNERTLTSEQLQTDGTWKQFMSATYRRKS
ncbi:MAG TPA: DUF1579 domain-containing protein [Burkholderiales bacterium]|nr:DUF1579 domain-containing protein [Burkholderiales bacterium]